jgi:uncharacterized membrane protein
MQLLFQMVGATTIILIILFIGFTLWHYFFYTLGYMFRGRTKTIEYLSNKTTGNNLLIYMYILFLLSLFISTFFGLIDSLGVINLSEIIAKINIALNTNIEIIDRENDIYRTIALFLSFLLVLANLLFIVKKKYIFLINQIFIKIIK